MNFLILDYHVLNLKIKNEEIGQDLRHTFSNSSGHTDAKKYWKVDLRAPPSMFFSKNQIFLKKIFLAKNHLEGLKIIFKQNFFLWKFRKKTWKNLASQKKLWIFSKCFWEFSEKIFFCLKVIRKVQKWFLAKKNFFWKKNLFLEKT